jgi:hypothetical protein
MSASVIACQFGTLHMPPSRPCRWLGALLAIGGALSPCQVTPQFTPSMSMDTPCEPPVYLTYIYFGDVCVLSVCCLSVCPNKFFEIFLIRNFLGV